MALSRQPIAYVSPSKHSLLSPASLSCGYSPFSDAPSITGYHAAGWGLDAASFPPQAPSIPMSQHRRWSSEEIASKARDRRSECRMSALEPLTTPAQVLPEHNTFSPSSTDLLRPPTFQTSYHRHSGDFTQWTPHQQQQWDIDSDILQPRFNNGSQTTSGTTASSWSSQLSNLQIPAFDPQQFDPLVFPESGSSSGSSIYTPNDHPLHLDGYGLLALSPIPSPSPSPVYLDNLPLHPHNPIPRATHRRHSDTKSESSNGSSGKSCSHCRATSTPLWRRDPSTMKPLCNACGLYLQQRNKLRPQELIDADDDGDTSDESDANYVGPECSHCHTHHTSVWRRSKSGEQLCNACGVYARLRGKPRPLSLKKRKIRPRSKHGPK